MAKSYVAFKREVLAHIPDAEVSRLAHYWFVTLREEDSVSVTGSSHVDGEDVAKFCQSMRESLEESVQENKDYEVNQQEVK